MKKAEKTSTEKEAIIAEYLLGEESYRHLGLKHGIDFRLIHLWVTKFQGRPVRKLKPKSVLKNEAVDQLPTNVRELQYHSDIIKKVLGTNFI